MCIPNQVFRVGASFLSSAKAASLASEEAGDRNPWFSKEALLKPRNAVVASPGYTFVSADYSQVGEFVQLRAYVVSMRANGNGDRDGNGAHSTCC